MNFRKNLQHNFPKMRGGGVEGRLELFRKFIRFGGGRHPLSSTRISYQIWTGYCSGLHDVKMILQGWQFNEHSHDKFTKGNFSVCLPVHPILQPAAFHPMASIENLHTLIGRPSSCNHNAATNHGCAVVVPGIGHGRNLSPAICFSNVELHCVHWVVCAIDAASHKNTMLPFKLSRFASVCPSWFKHACKGPP